MTQRVNRILLVEDDKDISRLLKMHLGENGFEVSCVFDGQDGLVEALRRDYELVILDVMLPSLDGVEICKRLREVNKSLPILMLTSKSDEVDKVLGLEMGADDYVTKPFSIREVLARVKGLLRRANAKESIGQQKTLFEFGELRIDLPRRRVCLGDKVLELTSKEFDLLHFLAANAGRPFTREELLSRVWNYEYEGYSNTVTSHINRLRSKLESDPSNPVFILTVWGVGYRFVESQELQG